MKRTCLKINTNTNEQDTCELHLDENSFKEQPFDPKDIQCVKSFVPMKKIILLATILALVTFSGNSQNQLTDDKTIILTGKSQSIYRQEPYVGKVQISYHGNKIKEVLFEIVDTLNNEVFGSDYEKHYPDHKLYQQQCRNDWQGVLNYPKQLLEKQDINKVDGITGATWSYNLFKASVSEALKKKGTQ